MTVKNVIINIFNTVSPTCYIDPMCGHLWYSHNQYQQSCQSNIALLENGQEVIYTEMSSRSRPSGLWNDYIYLGYGRYLRPNNNKVPNAYKPDIINVTVNISGKACDKIDKQSFTEELKKELSRLRW